MAEVNKRTIHHSTFEEELDYTYRRISELSTMIVGDEGSEVSLSPKKNNKFTFTGRKVRRNLAQTTEQSEQSLKMEKDLELITSAWKDMKEKESRFEDELSGKEVIIEEKRESLRVLREVNAEMAKKWEKTAEALEHKKEEYMTLERAKKDLDSEHEELKQMYSKTSRKKQTLEGIKTNLESDVSRLKRDVASLQQREKRLETTYIEHLASCNSKIINQEQQIQQLNEEKGHLLKRLSAIASDRLTHENANIADLSDTDRPTRLSEAYSELYDNEWTDAFEELTGKGQLSEENAIQFLLEILLNAFQKCRQITWDRYEAMKSVAITFDITHRLNSSSDKQFERKDVPNSAESKSDHYPKVPEPVHQHPSGPSEEQQQQRIPVEPMETNDYEYISYGKVGEMDVSRQDSVLTSGQSCDNVKKDADCIAEYKKESRDQAAVHLSFSVDQEKEIKTAWKRTCNAIETHALELLRSVLITGFEINDKNMPNLSRYVNGCVKICWKMGVQEKPLHLDMEVEKDYGSDRVFDADRFRAYTKTGKKVDYIVWPALFMHKGGAMLSKGIAQGY